MADRPADTKRVIISKAQRLTLFEVLIASLVLGSCLVIANFLIKYIGFNTKIIAAKNSAISDYDQTIRQVGVCKDSDKNGRLSDDEIQKCQPNQTALADVAGSLRYNIYETLAQNRDLEFVARQRDENGICYNSDGTIRDYIDEYNKATTDVERERALQGTKVCSSLRVISDALPNHQNTEALMASLNDIFLISDMQPENIAPRDDIVSIDLEGVGVIPVTFRVQGTGAEILRVLNNVEKSIRIFDIASATFEWTNGEINLRADANAFYLEEDLELETKITVRAASKNGGK